MQEQRRAFDPKVSSSAPAQVAGSVDPGAMVRRRRRQRVAWFIASEIGALALVVGSIVAGISGRFAADNLTPVFRILPIVGAALVVILPILFFGNPKRRSRWWR